MTEQESIRLNLQQDFANLNSAEQYASYFRELSTVFRSLLSCYESEGAKDAQERDIVSDFLQRFLYTIEVLRMKYSYLPDGERALWVDLTESGFPNSGEITDLQVKLEAKESLLRDIPPSAVLRERLVDHLFQHKEDSPELLHQLAQRRYLQMLSADKLFLPVSIRDMKVLSENDVERKYLISWACYDFATNRPYIHVMTFEQSLDDEPVSRNSELTDALCKVIETEGARAPDLAVLAMAIDDAIEPIYPKILKRICVGPLYSNHLLQGREPNSDDANELGLRSLFERYARRRNDFVLFFNDEVVFSRRQEISKGFLSATGKIRQIFWIQESDPECYARRASVVHKFALLPHYLLQHLEDTEREEIPGFDRAKCFSFDSYGVVHGL